MFSELKTKAAPLMQAIFELPFILELQSGDLDPAIFNFYLSQDQLYLKDYARALAICAAKLPDSEMMQQFMTYAQGALKGERELQQKLLTINTDIKPTPACFAYTNYLLKTAALDPVEVAVAAILPCFWIYHEVGQYLKQTRTHHITAYCDWIDFYASDDFSQSVKVMIGVLDRLEQYTSGRLSQQIAVAFMQAAELEWCFWRDAYLQISVS